MISYLSGTIQDINQNSVIVLVHDLGYRIFVVPTLLSRFKKGEKIEFFCHQYVREDSLSLYGFLKKEELVLFEQLITVSGIGPKTALGVLTVATPEEIKLSIIKEDSHLLTKVSGIGRKMASRIVLELKGKIEETEIKSYKDSLEDSEVIEALVGLGYKVKQAREALKQIPVSLPGPSEKIKEALKILSK